MFYNAYVKPHFVHCSTVWSNKSSSYINKITKLQRRACKLILSQDYTKHSRGPETIKYTVIDKLFQKRNINLDNTASNLRSVAHKNYLLPQAKCNLYKGSFSYSGVVVWNSFPTSIKLASSLDTFVKKCTEWLKI